MSKLARVAVAAAAVSLVLAPPAQAYLDPGTGSYVFQVVAATLVSIGFVIKSYWRQLRAYFAQRGRPRPPHEG